MGRGEKANVYLGNGEKLPADAEVLDEPEHRVVREAVRWRQAEHRLVVAVDQMHRHGGERDQRQREVDGEDRDRDHDDRARDAPHRVACLLREVRDGLDPRVGDHRNRDREQEVAPGRRRAEVDVRHEDVRAEDEREAEQHEQDLRGEVDPGEPDVDPCRLLDPDDVQPDEKDDDDRAADDVPRVLPQRLPEDREVVRHEKRRDGDRDDVVEHLRPGRPERDDLVEGVPREARGAAGLRVEHRPFRVRRSGRREEEAGDDEDDGRQPEREGGGYAERVVDRRADVAVRGGEKSVRPEDALELVRLATPSCHGGTVVPATVAPAPLPATGPVASITRHGAARSSHRSSGEKAWWKPRRESTGAPTTTSSARRSAATRATSSPRLPGRVRTISRRTATPYE